MTKSRGINRTRYVWHPDVEALFSLLYPSAATQVLANAIGISLSCAYSKAKMLGLKKSSAYLAGDLSGRIQRGRTDPRMAAGQFKKGGTSWNKGNKGWQAGGRSPETRFKKGFRPHNEKPIGSYRVVKGKAGWKTLEPKVSEVPGPNNLRWTPVARLVWESVHGQIQDGHLVVFKPGMATVIPHELTVDRLECISKEENGKRNIYHNRYSAELCKVIQIKGALQRQINKRSKNDQIDK